MPKTWFVTGSNRGLGRAVVVAALDAGDNVVATARRPDHLNELSVAHGPRLRVAALDVTNPVAVHAVVNDAARAFDGIDVVVNNAGYSDVAAVEDMGEDAFRAQIEANFFGTVHVTKAALPILREQGGGTIFQISSVGGRIGTPGLGAYQSAKWAVEGFSQVVAQEVEPFNIHVTVIEPGALRTDWAGSSMTIPDISEPYRSTVGAVAKMLRASDGTQTGDPSKVAKVLVDLSRHEAPPRQLLMGADAYTYATQADRARTASDQAWRSVTESVAYVQS